MNEPLCKRLAAEVVGSAFLLATIVGTSIMGAKLAAGAPAMALFVTSTSAGAMLTVLIWLFGPVSGAHLNPVVSLAFSANGQLAWRDVLPYCLAQLAGFAIGLWSAHAMFELPVLQVAVTTRTGAGHWLAEAIATFGLILVILGCVARRPSVVPAAVGLYIAAAYWFTASTAFANPAMTLVRALTATPAGILPQHVFGFAAAEIAGAALAILAGRYFWPAPRSVLDQAGAPPQGIPA